MSNKRNFFEKVIDLRSQLKNSKSTAKILFILLGIISTIWFLIRVIPKPSRATYPCIKAAAPFASSFVIYLMSITAGTFFIKRSARALANRKVFVASALGLAVIGAFAVSFFANNTESSAKDISFNTNLQYTANQPIGEAKGLFPGRVVWVHDKDATNENWTKNSPKHATDDSNVDQDVVNLMLKQGLKKLVNGENTSKAWDKLFRSYNSDHGRGDIGYTAGEKIAIKINLTNNGIESGERCDATPQLCYALLKLLVEEAGVAQKDITIGDPYRTMSMVYYSKLVAAFPDVNFVSRKNDKKIKQTTLSAKKVLIFSDGKEKSTLPQFYLDAAYLINVPIMKSHASNGITVAVKNHQGSVVQPGGGAGNQSAKFMHYAFPELDPGHKKYRHLVDYMGHEQLGGKTLLYLVDGLWAGHDWRGIVEKWAMEPFNNDFPNSLFLAQDPVAIESVCYDFLLEQYKNRETEKYPYMDGVDDYILQAADPANWPNGIQYDPEGDGTILKSLGVHEHWNNPIDKQYSRDLNAGNGIELIFSENFQKPDPDKEADPANYNAIKAEVAPTIDGIDNEICWQDAPWAEIKIDWYKEAGKNPPPFDSLDFYGRYKAVWDPDYLYLVVQITDDILNDDVADPLKKYSDDDCIEIFIDEDNSGGEHRNNYNAWAYHASHITYDVVDINSSGKPQLFNDHIDMKVTQAGTTYTCEFRIRIYNKNYTDAAPEKARVKLKGGTTMGFSLAYCEDDGNGRENFIGTISGGFDSWLNADLFGKLNLLEGPPTKYSLKIENGQGTGNYEKNRDVTISADPFKDGKEFDRWTGDTRFLSTTIEMTTTFKMPSDNISLTASYKNSTGIERKESEALKIYPNPVSEKLYINFPSAHEIYNIEIFNATGMKLITQNSRSNEIDVQDLEKGIYLLIIQTNKGKLSSKFIKN